MTQEKNISVLESLLFASGDPQEKSRLALVVGITEEEFEVILKNLETKYTETHSGLSLVHLGSRVQLTTKSENSEAIKKLLESELEEGMSKSALETLSIIAYRSPVTRAEIDSIRGVNSNFSLRNLLIRGLIERKGNPNDARGYVYTPTFDFLKTLGISKQEELPQYEILSQDERIELLLKQDDETIKTEDVKKENAKASEKSTVSTEVTPESE